MHQADVEDGRRPGVTKDEHAELVELRRELRVAKMEVEILKRGGVFCEGERSPKMTYTFIAGRCSDLPVAMCCRVMKVSTSGFYQWRAQPCSDRDYADAVLTNTIVDIHRMSRRSYGSPRVHAELRLAQETFRSRKRVERLMRQADVQGDLSASQQGLHET